MNIYLHELKSHIKSLLIWSGGMLLLLMGGMGKYSAGAAVSESGTGMNELISSIPQSMQNIFGVGVFDLTIIIDFYGVVYLYILVILASHAVSLGSGIISKEERDRTVEFLLVKPISRFSIVKSKLLAAVTICIVLILTTFLSSVFSFSLYSDELYIPELLKLCGSMFILQMCFLAIGTFFAGLISSHKRSTAAGFSVMLSMFTISLLVDIFEQVDVLKYFTFFQYVDSKDILKLGWSIIYPIIAVIIIAALLVMAFRLYQRRDMKIG
jgi:ABC-2 type transport system permease protein